MIFFWGIVGVLQVTALPGLLALRAARLRGGWGAVFALSLLVNFFAAWGLVSAGVYRTDLLRAGVLIEIAALAWLYRRELAAPLGQRVEALHESLMAGLEALRAWLSTVFQDGALAAAVRCAALAAGATGAAVCLGWAAQLFARSLGGVFNTWDAVLSWNAWATEWSRGAFPSATGTYPQLGPANWSVMYVLAGRSDIQLFARSVMPLFFAGILLLQTQLGGARRSYGILLGVPVTFLVMLHFSGEFLADGYMDVPAAFLSFLSIYFLMLPPGAWQADSARSRFWLSALAAAAAALTKQTGAFFLLLWPALAFLLVPGATRRAVWRPFALGLALAGLYYGFRAFATAGGLDGDNTLYLVSDIHGGRSLLERAQYALNLLGRYAPLVAFPLAAVIWQTRPARRLTLAVYAPGLAIWALLYSYDTRNLAAALPLLGLLSGMALEQAVEILLRKLPRLERLPAAVLPALVAAALLGGGALLWNDAKLAAVNDRARREIFNAQLNRDLYAYFEANGRSGLILTNYPVRFLPDLENAQRSYWYNDLPVFLSELKNPDNGYLLVPASADEAITAVIERKAAAGELKFLFEASGGYAYRFYRIERGAP